MICPNCNSVNSNYHRVDLIYVDIQVPQNDSGHEEQHNMGYCDDCGALQNQYDSGQTGRVKLMTNNTFHWCLPRFNITRPADTRPRFLLNRYPHNVIGGMVVVFKRGWGVRWKKSR